MSDTAIVLVVTDAGMARFTAAQGDEDIDLTIAEVGLTATAFTAAPGMTGIPDEFRRLTTVTGAAVGDDTLHLTITDDGATGYTARGFGLFLADGTLFAAYGQAGVLATKNPATALLIAVDVVFPVAGVEQVTFGDIGFLNPPATTDTRGVVELATQAQANAGTPGPYVISAELWHALIGAAGFVPATRAIHTDGLLTGAGDLGADLTLDVPRAFAADVLAATSLDKAVTPASLASLPKSLGSTGYATLPGGLIVQWGTYRGTIGSETSISVAFPLTFPNACLARLATGYVAAASAERNMWPQILGAAAATGMSVQIQWPGDRDEQLDGFDWLVVGF